MNIIDIKESGSNNLLLYAISNQADIKSNINLQALINDETCYLITIDNVNFLELFRLTQRYREKLRVLDEKRAEIPSQDELKLLFNGECALDDEKPDEKVKFSELVEYSCQTFLNLALQMTSDDDIIRSESARMFLPMLTRKFTIQIPISFMDVCAATEDNSIFSTDYPNTIIEEIHKESSKFRDMLSLMLVRYTSIIRYEESYDTLMEMSKYFPLRKSSDKLYKYGIIDFYKYDNIGRGQIRCSLFKPNKATLAANMKKMAHLSTPLYINFAVQVPIQYMEYILNAYAYEELPITYESSMSGIIEESCVFNDFITIDPEDEHAEEHNNSISLYKTRIAEANQIMLNTMPLLLNSQLDVDVTSVFAMLPSIYMAKAVFTFRMDRLISPTPIQNLDGSIQRMFSEMISMAQGIQRDINSNK